MAMVQMLQQERCREIAHLAPSTIAELNQYAVAYEVDTPDKVVQFISLQLLLGWGTVIDLSH